MKTAMQHTTWLFEIKKWGTKHWLRHLKFKLWDFFRLPSMVRDQRFGVVLDLKRFATGYRTSFRTVFVLSPPECTTLSSGRREKKTVIPTARGCARSTSARGCTRNLEAFVQRIGSRRHKFVEQRAISAASTITR